YVGYLFFQLKTHADYLCAAALACLLGITLIVAVCSEYLTVAIESVSETSGINQAFLGLIVLPIAGNAAEHITDFDAFAVLMLTGGARWLPWRALSVILAYFVSSDGSSNWLLGLQLVATYCLIGFVFLLEREPANVALSNWGR
ncbi:hypothetical protein ABPG77_006094, partial [Micractinium sp. CCAP 211/92]